ncbi:MAG: alkaline phosphatase family protein [Theionarchaea archaeon]|nr:alkaline phosphatase family protein [Theionarchaea archaeon]MBU7036677.1 alkaline phosphatase family protein [Theionarchaea archaeon]
MNKRAVIIGIDGVPFRLMDELSQQGVMPYFGELRETGAFTQMTSSIPEVSSVSWSSIITGKNPGEHSVYGFTELFPSTYTLSFPNSKRLKASPFWQKQGEFCIINVPSTYPASSLNGVLVSGFISPDLERAVYPSNLLEVLNEFNYTVDIDTKKARKFPMILFKELFEALESRVAFSHYLWERIKWDVFMVVFTGSDRLGHFLWDAYEDESHKYRGQFLQFFSRIDEALREFGEKLNPDDALIILSDHGMEQTQYNLNVNCILEEAGFLRSEKDPRKGYNNIQEGSRAFALDPGRIYINKKGKYPRGYVEPGEEEAVISELCYTLKSLEINGQKAISCIHENPQIYHGPYTEAGPDLVLMPARGVNLKGGILSGAPLDRDILPGKHTQEDAFVFVRGDCTPVESPTVENVVPILTECLGWYNESS